MDEIDDKYCIFSLMTQRGGYMDVSISYCPVSSSDINVYLGEA